MVEGMDTKQWLTESAHRPIYDQEIADILGISRKTANKRINDGLDASDLITLARGLGINPVMALQELGYLTINEVFDFLDADGTLLATAATDQLVYQLAEEMLTADQRIALGRAALTLVNRSNVVDFQSARPGMPLDAVADDSDYHDEENTEFDD